MSSRLDRITNWEVQARRAHYRASELARIICVSDRHLRRHFADLYGVSPQEWIDHVRLRESLQLLQKGESVKAVAYQLGYRQVSHFCTVFKRHFGTTPSSPFCIVSPICPHQITNVREKQAWRLEVDRLNVDHRPSPSGLVSKVE